jgi:hypothetical protein
MFFQKLACFRNVFFKNWRVFVVTTWQHACTSNDPGNGFFLQKIKSTKKTQKNVNGFKQNMTFRGNPDTNTSQHYMD